MPATAQPRGRDAIPDLASKIDLRWEYGLHPSGEGVFTDYDNTKVLLALKLNGFETSRRGLLKHLELHLGYYTRDFSEPDRERNLYVGIGLNLTDLLCRHGHAKTATVLNYLQLPGTYLPLTDDFNPSILMLSQKDMRWLSKNFGLQGVVVFQG